GCDRPLGGNDALTQQGAAVCQQSRTDPVLNDRRAASRGTDCRISLRAGSNQSHAAPVPTVAGWRGAPSRSLAPLAMSQRGSILPPSLLLRKSAKTEKTLSTRREER